MKEEAGNEYQGLSVEGIGITVFATQLTHEYDSEDNQYDKNAGWDGTIPATKPDSLVVDTTNKLISINDVEAFAYLNTLIENESFIQNYGSTWKYTIELNTDVNLLGKAWTPILMSNFVAFEGNGHTISNLHVSTNGSAGLFADISCNDIGVTYVRNLIIDGAYVKGENSVGALAGLSSQGAIENVTINNATVIGNKYVGGVFGWGNGSVNNSTVKNSTVTISENGAKEAGGLIGYLSNDGKSSNVNKVIAGNAVENVTVKAPTIASDLVSQPNSSNIGGAKIEIKNNTMKKVTIIAADSSASLYVSNNVSGKSIVKDNTATDCEVACEVYGLYLTPVENDGSCHGIITIDSKEELLNLSKLLGNWKALFATKGDGSNYGDYANYHYYYYLTQAWKAVLTTDVDFGGAKIDPINLGLLSELDFQGHTIKNAVIVTDSTTENEAGLFIGNYCGMKNLKLDNIHVTGSNVGNSTAGVLAGSCNQNMGIDNVTITNSSVTGGKYTGGVIGYGYTDVINCSLTNVTVKGGYKLGGVIGYICASGSAVGDVTGNTLKDCAVDGIGGSIYAGGKDKYIIGKVVGNYNCNGTCNNNTITNMTTSATANIGEIEAGKTVTQ